MSLHGRLLLTVLVAVACGQDDAPAICEGDRAIHLTDLDVAVGKIQQTVDDTFIQISSEQGNLTQIGPDCGAAALTFRDLLLRPSAVQFDPADDDPTIACDQTSRQFYRLDPDGRAAPQLLLPHLRCPGLPTNHGPVFATTLADRALWLVPDFPDDSTAVQIGRDVARTGLVGDFLYHLDHDGVLARTDLTTGAAKHLLDGVAAFDATTTHVLARSDIDPDTAPIDILDIAAGTRTHVGLFQADIDDTDTFRATTDTWGFDTTGRYVLHFGADPTPLAAYDLAGRSVVFPAEAETVRAGPDGVYVVCDGPQILAARPGDPDVRLLDTPSCVSSEFVGDHLEALIDGDLYRVPLDGGPRSLLARDIGAAHQWLDEHHILTSVGGDLITVVAATNVRRRHAAYAWSFKVFPGRGVYYEVAHPDTGDPANGLWFLPESRLYPSLPPCETGYYCR